MFTLSVNVIKEDNVIKLENIILEKTGIYYLKKKSHLS